MTSKNWIRVASNAPSHGPLWSDPDVVDLVVGTCWHLGMFPLILAALNGIMIAGTIILISGLLFWGGTSQVGTRVVVW